MSSLSFLFHLSPPPLPLRPRLHPTTSSPRFRRREMISASTSASSAVTGLGPAFDPDPFVAWFRRAWPYVRAHRGSTFVIVIGGEVVDDGACLDGVLQDVALLHGLGMRFVIVPATNVVMERVLGEKGKKGEFVGPYRVTDAAALDAAMEAAGRVRQMVEARLSPGPSMLSLRRHGDCRRWHEVGVPVAGGNFLAGKRRGVVEGVDFGATGEVKKIDISRICERLDSGCIVVVSNLGYSSSGEVLNCNSYEVATACALAIQADKLVCIIDGQILDENGHRIQFMTLQDADMWIRKRSGSCETAANYIKAVSEDANSLACNHSNEVEQFLRNKDDLSKKFSATFHNGVGFDNGNGFWNDAFGFPVRVHRLRRYDGYISELAAAVFVCKGGVQRVHLVDGTLGGALLLELFTRDGVGTMVASDAYEGIREATEADLLEIKQLFQPLEKCGALVSRTAEELEESLGSFIIAERDGSIVAGAALFPYFVEGCAEVASFAISPDLCGNGQERNLLDYVERKAASLGLHKLFLLTTSTSDWFVRQGFVECNVDAIPRERRERIDLSGWSKYYIKSLRSDLGGSMSHQREAQTF